ncbi:MAG: Holliday junction branch migration protein RuvA [Candidatus Latescibacterota bacterium]|nr:Holliday junction branch migration protein RuvA [Candidatus Latescibacterota bacterium]
MISYLRGKIAYKAPMQAVIDVGGVGYGVSISLVTYDQLPILGEEVLLFTHMHVREDRMELFAFADEGEREVFEMLIGVSGIGPSLGLTILSGMSLRDLQDAIVHERVSELTGIKGIGKRTAERLVLDLRDKVSLSADISEIETQGETGSAISEEAAMALMALGMTPSEARQAVMKAIERNGSDLTVQQLIKFALKER